ncbi:MAG TPA: PAS domain-containing protein [Candidatus Sulfomarinibacteraceae bacterium]|nr:PAS domain-containing protein [Candidatus Sulfomarinibacteraceae bacterium]
MTEEQLRDRVRMLAAVLENTPMMAVYLDPQFNFVWVNQAYARSCGHEPAFFRGKNHFDLFPHPENETIFRRVVETGEPFFVAAKPFEFPDQPERGVTYWDWSLVPHRNPDGTIAGLAFTLAEVTDRILADQALRDKEQEFRNLAENAPDIISRLDTELRHIFVNQVIRDVTSMDPVEFIGKTNRELGMPAELCELWDGAFLDAMTSRRTRTIDFEFAEPSGSRCFEARIVPELEADGSVASLLCITRDITDRKRMEDELRAGEQKFRNIVANLPGFFFRYKLNPDGTDELLYVSNGVEALFEVPPDDAVSDVGLLWDRIHPDDVETTVASVRESAANLTLWELKYRIKLPDGRLKWLHGRGVPARQDDGSVVWDTLGIDITGVMQAEEALRDALAEKEVLLREIHHRVKNNMQIIIGLLRLQAEHISEPQALAAFEDSQSRIMAMAQVHDTLYRSGNLSSVSCRDYLTKLVDGVASAHRVDGVEVLVDICDEPIQIDQAIPIGLVVTEIVSNAMKHAFPHGGRGRVTAVMRVADGQRFELEVRDDGVGMAGEVDLDGTRSLGLHLVNILVTNQLDGVLKISNDGGTRFEISFERQRDDSGR